jgi:hypothetical protein
MRNVLIERLTQMSESVMAMCGSSDYARVLVQDTVSIVDEMIEVSGIQYVLPKLHEIDSAELIESLKMVLGDDHPVEAVMQYPESAASAIQLETLFETEVWDVVRGNYPAILRNSVENKQAFSPESHGAEPPEEDGYWRPTEIVPHIVSVSCIAIFLAICDAATEDEDGLSDRLPLLKLIIQDNIYPIGFGRNGRVVFVPVAD